MPVSICSRWLHVQDRVKRAVGSHTRFSFVSKRHGSSPLYHKGLRVEGQLHGLFPLRAAKESQNRHRIVNQANIIKSKRWKRRDESSNRTEINSVPGPAPPPPFLPAPVGKAIPVGIWRCNGTILKAPTFWLVFCSTPCTHSLPETLSSLVLH